MQKILIRYSRSLRVALRVPSRKVWQQPRFRLYLILPHHHRRDRQDLRHPHHRALRVRLPIPADQVPAGPVVVVLPAAAAEAVAAVAGNHFL